MRFIEKNVKVKLSEEDLAQVFSISTSIEQATIINKVAKEMEDWGESVKAHQIAYISDGLDESGIKLIKDMYDCLIEH